MFDRPWFMRLVWLAVTAGLLTGAGLIQPKLDELREQHELIAPGNEVAKRHPLTAILTLALGGLRAPFVTYLWIRSENLKESGRHFDAMQSAQMICRMMPRFPGVWDFQSWNMAWNISVQTHTPEERWLWVYNGIRLLRDEGIPLNPKALILYKQMGWIFFSKMGDYTDEMHLVYKRRWAAQMQRLLAPPPDRDGRILSVARGEGAVLESKAHGLSAGEHISLSGLDTTVDIDGLQMVTGVVDADHFRIGVAIRDVRDGKGSWHRDALEVFRPIAEAPLNKKHPPSGEFGAPLQRDEFEKLLAGDAEVAAFARGIGRLLTTDKDKREGRRLDQIIGHRLLNAYNRFSLDEALEVVRHFSNVPDPKTDTEKAVSKLINSEDNAPARRRLLAFVRAHILYNRYRMDPQWMMAMMEQYGPLDWRHVFAHGLYWTTYGIHVCESRSLDQIDAINTDRIVLNCMKAMTWNGRLTYVENPQEPDSPTLNWFSDWRYVRRAHDVHNRFINAIIKTSGKAYKDNILKDGHVNYVAAAIGMLYAGYRRQQAEELYQEIKRDYQLKGREWDLPLEEFVVARLDDDDSPIPDIARSQIMASMQMAFLFLVQGDQQAFQDNMRYAARVHSVYQKAAPRRLKLPGFGNIVGYVLRDMLAQPRVAGLNLSLDARMRLYQTTTRFYEGAKPQLLRQLYRVIKPRLMAECASHGVDFRKAFPPP